MKSVFLRGRLAVDYLSAGSAEACALINLEQAVQAAFRSNVDVFGDEISGSDLRLEEVERVELPGEPKRWHVTISFLRRKPNDGEQRDPSEENVFRGLLSPKPYEREYKQVVIDAESGEFQGIRIRSLVA